ncbi:hypothetical protein PHJA_001482900 [Phtheirospermum japonicum]|uniref:ANK_REP_REGION domain-containing protein n=1 Tax=Phtheirospermum japonicum TaxID=374723 RepID=A0A830CDR1_9LAMI|nr:hypothetical protein PHJA_001482900 [Phtheirospermum japonicum]
MDCDNVVSAVSDDEELQPDQLYFALALSQLRHRLQAEDMASLAVKASSALTKSGGCGGENCVCRRNNLVFPRDNGDDILKAAIAVNLELLRDLRNEAFRRKCESAAAGAEGLTCLHFAAERGYIKICRGAFGAGHTAAMCGAGHTAAMCSITCKC